MLPKVNNPGDRYEVFETLTRDRTYDLQNNRCPRCDRFGVVSDTHDYYGIIYKCNCQSVFWVINPETGDRIEEVKP